jgi:tetratricopeptide (TPR) repeat protein
MTEESGFKPEPRPEIVERYENMLAEGGSYFFDSEEFEEIIDYYIDINQASKALKAISLAERHYPFSVGFLLRKAQILSSTGNTKEALNILSNAEAIEPQNPEIYMVRGGTYSIMGLSDQAIDCFKEAARLDTGHRDEIYLYMAYEYENISQFDNAIFKEKPGCQPRQFFGLV